MHTLDAVLQELHRLGDVEKGRRFERVCAWLLESDPAFAVRKTYLWNQWREHRLIRDGVAELDSGELWAVQAKCYAQTTRVSTGDIDSFIARSATSEFAHLLLIATTNDVARSGRRKMLEARNPSASLLLLDDLRALERDDWPGVGERIRPAVHRPQQMRPHQLAAVGDVVERGFLSAEGIVDRGQLLMACGTGKTLVGQRVAEKLRSERMLVVVPSLSLIEQAHRSWKANATRSFEAFCFCSDSTVAARSAEETDRDVESIAVPVHTDPEQLGAFLALKNGRVVVFATYQSLDRLCEVFGASDGARSFDLLVADEAHRSAGRVTSSFGLVCDATRLPATRRLFMTATPRVVIGAGDKDLVLSMDDEARYGHVFHHLRFSDAVAQGLLCDYEVLVIAAEPSEYVRLVESRSFVSTPEHETTSADALAIQLAVARAMASDGLRRVLTFHSRVKSANAFGREFPATVRWRGAPSGELWTQAVSGAMPAGRRRLLLRRLERLDGIDYGVISNTRCFGEGVDVPAIDAVAFVDARESVIDIVQAVGRTMRRSPETGNERGVVILPVVLDAGANADDTLSSSAFGTVWQVLRALRSHDDRLDDEMEASLHARVRGRPRSSSVPRVSFDLPTIAVDSGFAHAFSVKAVDVTTDGFERGRAELAAYVEAHGDSRVAVEYRSPTGFNLGMWCATRRKEYNTGRLSKPRMAALEEFGFIWDPFQHEFDCGLAEFKAYVEAHGVHTVSKHYVTATGFELGAWCGARRYDNKVHRLSEERIEALDALGFVWNTAQDRYDRGLDELKAYAAANGHARAPQGYRTVTGFNLGDWCARLRKQRRSGKLSASHVAALDEVGFVWDPFKQSFERGLSELRTYVEMHGNARVPRRNVPSTRFNLAAWCNHQRVAKRAGRLSPEQVATLEALGFVWEPWDETFEQGLTELKTYVVKHGNARVKSRYVSPSGFQLGAWCGRRRRELTLGRLDASRAEALDELGFVWEGHFDELFERGLKELKSYVEANGDARVPTDYRASTGYNLGAWCARRRIDSEAGRLSDERKAALEALGFP